VCLQDKAPAHCLPPVPVIVVSLCAFLQGKNDKLLVKACKLLCGGESVGDKHRVHGRKQGL
jgi:hypothetical protein